MPILISLVVIVIFLSISSAIGAMLIRAAVALFNKLRSSESSGPEVPEPEFGKAFGIALASTLVSGVMGYVVGMLIGAQAAASRTEPNILLAQLIALPLGYLVMAVMLTATLPTTFVRGLVITLMYVVIAALIYGFFAVLLLVTGLITL